jgi:hypothetical protein
MHPSLEILKNVLAVIGAACVLSSLVIALFCAVAYRKKD